MGSKEAKDKEKKRKEETTKENKKKETLEKERIVKEKQRKELVPKELLSRRPRRRKQRKKQTRSVTVKRVPPRRREARPRRHRKKRGARKQKTRKRKGKRKPQRKTKRRKPWKRKESLRRSKREKTGKEVKTKESEKKSKILVRTKINCQIALKHGKEEVVKEVANYQKMLTDLPDASKCKDNACLCMVQKAAATQFKIANQLTEDRKATILMNTRVLCVEKFMEKPHNKKQLAAAKYQCASINWNDLSLAKYRAEMMLKKKKLTSAAATAKC